MDKRLKGMLEGGAGAIMGLYGLLTILNDTAPRGHGLLAYRLYDYEPPLTSHELTMIFLVFGGLILLVCGAINLIAAVVKKQEQRDDHNTPT